ncbi:putative apyrase [Chloropicon primus]|uniref:Putative apyrase n=3 Tax=Chloropicon primus TaxID=1764295 RepID=A0A5B8MCR3_9CHLO|nr:putative apyrase [Chloropicon primus]UPQ97166.1 putative apyrase [Chloropicon primus]|eukprot:QDZ17951.1 putative apyrase [Chloropicon primus]
MQKLISSRVLHAKRNRRGRENIISWIVIVLTVAALIGYVLWDGYRGAGRGMGSLVLGPPSSHLPHHVLVVDCGSTGTRLNIIGRVGGDEGEESFRAVGWEEFKVPFPGYTPKKHGYNRLETMPGIHHTAAGGLKEVKAALEPLLDWAKEALRGSGDLGEVPILLFATAGVRKLEAGKQKALMGHVRHVLSSSGFRFQPEWARIITGEDEGIFSWVSSNYKLGNFGPAAAGAMNVLELGGSSLQASYVVDSAGEGDTKPVKVLDRTYNLRVKSFNGYGMNDAFNSSLYHLLSEGGVVVHPCFQAGFSFEPGELDVRYEGGFDADKCRRVIKGGLPNESVRGYHEGVRGARADYIALAGFYLVYSFFEIDLTTPLSEAFERMASICAFPFEEGFTEEERGDKNAGLYCFRSVYVDVILREWMGLAQVKVYDESEWALGAAILLHHELDDEERERRRIEVGVEVGARWGVRGLLAALLALGMVLAGVALVLKAALFSSRGGRRGVADGGQDFLLPVWRSDFNKDP